MTAEIVFMLVLVAAALVAFFTEIFPIEVTALGLLGILLVTGVVEVDQALAGFSNKAVITIGGLFVMSQALFKSGLVETAAGRVSQLAGRYRWLAIAALLGSVSVLSGFLNNTAVVAILIPMMLDLARRLEISPSKLLLPLSYAAIFGGTLTLIGTSTNLLVSSLAEDMGQPPFTMFEFSRLGAVMVVLGLAYVLVAVPRIVPDRVESGGLTSKYRMGAYLSEVRLEEESRLVGSSADQAQLNERYDVTILAVLRGDQRHDRNLRTLALEAGDVLMVRAAAENLVRLNSEQGVTLLPDVALHDEELSAGGQLIVEALITRNSRMIGRSPRELRFRRRLGGFVLAVGRQGAMLRKRLAEVRLRFADTLLVLIPRERLEQLRGSEDLLVLSEVDFGLRRHRLWWLPLAVLPAVVTLAALGILQIAAGALVGAIVVLMAGLLTTQEAYRAVDWSVLILIAAFVPVGHAIVETGTASFIASGLAGAGGYFPAHWAPYATVALLYLVTSLMTEMVSNSAAAIILTPVAIDVSSALGVDARPFLMAICFAASASFMTPMGYQTNLMVFGPGGYRFGDYLRAGGPLNLLFWIVAALLIPRLWPF